MNLQLPIDGFSDFVIRIGEERESDTYGYWAELRHVKKGSLMMDSGQTKEEAVSALSLKLKRLSDAVRFLR